MPSDRALIRIIDRALADAREAGADYRGQTERAVAAVLTARPDMAQNEVFSLVERFRTAK
jgi:hypothetical protein